MSIERSEMNYLISRRGPDSQRFNFGFRISIFEFLLRCILWASVAIFGSCGKSPSGKSPRLVSLVPSITEIIYALGKGENLIGNTIYCDYPEEAKRVYKIGDFSNPNLEKIIALKPDIVFATLPEQSNVITRLKELKIKVFTSQPKTLSGLLSEIQEISKILKAEKKGDLIINEINSALRIRLRRTRVYIEISAKPLITIGKESFLNDILQRIGAQNIFEDIEKEYPVVSAEEIIRRDPEVIIILHPLSNQKEVTARIGWQRIEAIKEGRVYDDINPDLLLRPGPRIVQGILELVNRMESN